MPRPILRKRRRSIKTTSRAKRTRYVPRSRQFRTDPIRSLIKMATPLPKQLTTKLRYNTTVTINGGLIGSVARHVFRATSLYDPDYTSTGHQPRGFDQIMQLYDHFVVRACRIRVEFAARASSSYTTIVGIALRDSSAGYGSINVNDVLENGKVSHNLLPHCSSGQGSIRTMTMNFRPKQFLGVKDEMSLGQLKGAEDANPTENAFFHVFAAALQSEDPAPIECNVQLEYLTTFIEPKAVGQS